MAYIELDGDLPGMRALLNFRPAIAPSLSALTNVLLRSDEGLSKGERELIGAFVSALNDCSGCRDIHGAVAQCHLGVDEAYIAQVLDDFQQTDLPEKMKALLTIASSAQRGGKFVTPEQVDTARSAGATDLEIHDTVLITGLFCLFNRYIDGLGIISRDTPETYLKRAEMLAEHGYSS